MVDRSFIHKDDKNKSKKPNSVAQHHLKELRKREGSKEGQPSVTNRRIMIKD